MGKKQDYKSLALDYIVKYAEDKLGFAPADFIEWLSSQRNGKSEKTLWRYIKGKTPMKSWTFREFWVEVDCVIQNYLEDEVLWKRTVPNAPKIWADERESIQARCALFFLCSDTPIGAEEFPDEIEASIKAIETCKEEMLDAIRPIFEKIDPVLAYNLKRNFPALSSVTPEDIEFWSYILNMTDEDKAELLVQMKGKATVDAGTMLEHLQSEEVRCWVALKTSDYTDAVRKTTTDSWEQFRKRFMELPLHQFAGTVSFLLASLTPASSYPAFAEREKIEIALPSRTDIDLLLLFKYCLASEERRQLLFNE